MVMRRHKFGKFGAVPAIVDGIRFASRREARRYRQLRLLEAAGVIARLELQPEFRCEVNGRLVCKYFADFRYFDHDRDEVVIEDVKGVRTDVYRLKKRLVEALYPGVEIEEI